MSAQTGSDGLMTVGWTIRIADCMSAAAVVIYPSELRLTERDDLGDLYCERLLRVA